jgi:hypothetical protein
MPQDGLFDFVASAKKKAGNGFCGMKVLFYKAICCAYLDFP